MSRNKLTIGVIILVCILLFGLGGYCLTKNRHKTKVTPPKLDSNSATPYYKTSPSPSVNSSVDKSGTKLFLFVDLMVHNNDTVTENAPITIGKGRPPIGGRNRDGDYLLRILDKVDRSPTGSALWSEPFNVYFDYTGPVVMGEDYSEIKYTQVGVSFQIPYEPKMKSIQLWHKDKLIYFKELPQYQIEDYTAGEEQQSPFSVIVEIGKKYEDGPSPFVYEGNIGALINITKQLHEGV